MQITRSFSSLNLPTFPIKVSGPAPDLFGKHTFDAGIDTGFTGFLSLPFLSAVKAGLIFGGAMPLTLADGSSQTFLYCIGMAEINQKSGVGLILVTQSQDVLAGMEFLKLLNLQLIVDPSTDTATLTDENPPLVPSTDPANPSIPPKSN